MKIKVLKLRLKQPLSLIHQALIAIKYSCWNVMHSVPCACGWPAGRLGKRLAGTGCAACVRTIADTLGQALGAGLGQRRQLCVGCVHHIAVSNGLRHMFEGDEHLLGRKRLRMAHGWQPWLGVVA